MVTIWWSVLGKHLRILWVFADWINRSDIYVMVVVLNHKCQRNYPFEVFFVKLKSDKKFDEEVDVGTLTFVVDVVTVEILVRTWVNLIPRHYNKRWHCLQQSSQTHINNYTTQQKGGFPLSRTKKTWFPIFDAVEAIISIYPKKKTEFNIAEPSTV